MNTPITDRNATFADVAVNKTIDCVPIETARSLERIAGELAENLKLAIRLAEQGGWDMGDIKMPLARWQAMKDEATK